MVSLIPKTKISAPFYVPLNSGLNSTLIVFNHNLGTVPTNVRIRVDDRINNPGLNTNAFLHDTDGNGGTLYGYFVNSSSAAQVEVFVYRYAEMYVRVIVTA